MKRWPGRRLRSRGWRARGRGGVGPSWFWRLALRTVERFGAAESAERRGGCKHRSVGLGSREVFRPFGGKWAGEGIHWARRSRGGRRKGERRRRGDGWFFQFGLRLVEERDRKLGGRWGLGFGGGCQERGGGGGLNGLRLWWLAGRWLRKGWRLDSHRGGRGGRCGCGLGVAAERTDIWHRRGSACRHGGDQLRDWQTQLEVALHLTEHVAETNISDAIDKGAEVNRYRARGDLLAGSSRGQGSHDPGRDYGRLKAEISGCAAL